MQAPIPDPFATPEKPGLASKGPRPPGLIWMIGLSWLFNLGSTTAEDIQEVGWAFYAFMWALSVLFDYALWRGHNWARIITMIVAPLAFLSPFLTDRNNPLSYAFSIGDAIFYFVYLVYLTRPAVIQFFKGQPLQSSAKAGSA